MADKDFVVKNGLVVNSNVLVVNGANVGVNTATPDAVFTVAGTANIQGNVAFTGNEVNATANVTFFGNLHSKNVVYIDQKLFVGNTETMVQDLPTIIQAVNDFNGFVMVSSQNLSKLDDACADLLIYADDTNGLSNFNDLGINNSRFDGRIHRIIANSAAANWTLGQVVYQRNGAGANIAVGELRDIAAINATAVSLRIRVSEDDGISTYVGMADFANTAGSNLSLYAVDNAANADIISAVPFFSPQANTLTRRNYAFTVGKRGDGYLYNANSALTIGTTGGGIRSTSLSLATSFSSGVNTIILSTGNTQNVKQDMNLTGTGIAPNTYITSVINTTAFKISKPTILPLASGTITARDEFYDIDDYNNPIIFHTGGMMAKNEIARFTGNGNFTIGPNTTSRAAKLTVNGTANIAGQTNVSANVNVTGNINASANVNGSRGIFTAAVNVGISSLSTTQAQVGSNVIVDAAGLKISGNTLIPSMNVSGGNITIGNNSVANSPTVQLTNATASANYAPSGIRTGNITINSLGSVVNVGANVWINATTISIGNATCNVIIRPSDAPDYIMRVTGNASIDGHLLVKGDAIVNGSLTFANTVNVNGDFVPLTSFSFDLGKSDNVWRYAYIRNINVPAQGNVSVGNSTLNSVMNFDGVLVQNATSISNVGVSGLITGNSTVNGQYYALETRIGNSTSNAALNATSLVIGTSSVNSTINAQALSISNVFSVLANSTTVNSTTVNATTVAATTVNASAGRFVTVNSSSINSTSINATSITSTNVTANIFAVSVNSTSMNVTTANSTTVNATTVNATTVNASTLQIGSAFRANSTQVTTANLIVLGNLQITGTTTFVNTAVLDVTDINITIGKGAINPAAADGGGMTLEGANVSLNYSAASGNWVSNTGISVANASGNVTLTSTGLIGNSTGVHVGNVVATTISGNLTGNVAATTITGNLAGNVTATFVSAVANVTVGAGVLVNTTAVVVSNSTAVSLQTPGLMGVGNGSIVSAPQILVQNTSGITVINSNFISTASISGNLTGNVSATTIGASANISLGANVVANTSGNFASHLGGFAASNYVKFSGSGEVGMSDGGTNSSITPAAGGVVFSNSTGMAVTGVGTSGQVLTSAAAGTPTWTSQASLSVGTSANLGSFAAASYQLRSDLDANVASLGYLKTATLNANVAALGYDNFPSGTKLLFQQSAAPTGWTKDLTHDNKAIRIVSGTVGSGGTVNFTTAFSSKAFSGTTGTTGVSGTTGLTTVTGTVGSTTLLESQIPSHTHPFTEMGGRPGDAGSAGLQYSAGSNLNAFNFHLRTTSATGGSGSHTHSFSGGSHDHSFNAGSHSHSFSSSIDMSVQYVDVVVCTKN